jgi:spore photoproduct lyase family protein
VTSTPTTQREQATRLLNINTIYYEPTLIEYPRGREILEQYPEADRIEVASHWNIPELHGNEEAVGDWNKIKRTVLVLGVKKSLSAKPYDRSSDFVAPSHANGCAMACAYCYVARRKGFANPITTFVNIEQICGYLERHAARRGTKPQPTQADPTLWVYELGTNSDCSVDAAICDNLKDLIALFRKLPNAKATFATKYVNRDLLNYDPQGKTRIRFSLMPQSISQIVDVRTSKISDRINAVNDFLEAGYEVNLNFAPVIYYDNWLQDYQELFQLIDDTLSPQAKAQLQAEVVFLTHNEQLHEVNLGWHPQAEELLWRPDLQETKISGTGGKNLRYKRGFKRELVDTFCQLLATHLPYCSVRYAF